MWWQNPQRTNPENKNESHWVFQFHSCIGCGFFSRRQRSGGILFVIHERIKFLLELNQNHHHVFSPDWAWYTSDLNHARLSHQYHMTALDRKNEREEKRGNCYVKMSGQIFPSRDRALLIMDPKSPSFSPFILSFSWFWLGDYFKFLPTVWSRCLEGTVHFPNRRLTGE